MKSSAKSKGHHRRAMHLDSLIDEAVEESFPASDPPAVHTERDPVGRVRAKSSEKRAQRRHLH